MPKIERGSTHDIVLILHVICFFGLCLSQRMIVTSGWACTTTEGSCIPVEMLNKRSGLRSPLQVR